MQTLHKLVNSAALPKLTARISTQHTPTTTAGAIGVPVRGFTCDSTAEKGSLPSRAIENISREAAV